jgi:hypothetical protein
MRDALAYRTTWSRHLHNLVISGFYARDLDADDFAFLEHVRKCGSANGSLPGSGAVLLEELEFWNLPYTLAPDVTRRVGPVPRPVPTPEERAIRQARYSVWHAKRVIRENERAIAEAELERERIEFERTKIRREWRERLNDAEWEAANPANFHSRQGRFHVPHWKVEAELDAAKVAKDAMLEKRKAAAEAKREAARERDRLRRQKIINDARATVARVTSKQQQWAEAAAFHRRYPDAFDLKRKIVALIRGSAPYFWTREELMRATGCDNLELLNVCLDQLADEGQVRKMKERAA